MAIKDLLLSTLPQYCETLISGKNVCFRPMIVSEEKALLLSKHSNNKQATLKTLLGIINSCFDSSKDWSIYDFEHMFLLLRAKSIGEIEEFTIKCPETGEEVNLKINLIKDVVLNKTKTNNKIKINDNLLLMFKEPTVKTILKYPNYKDSTEELHKFIGSCIKEIQTQKEIISCSDLSEKELTDFVNNLTSLQFKSVISYFDNLPSLQVVGNYTTTDGVLRNIKIKGIFDYINFFFNHLTPQLFYVQMFQLKYNHNYSIQEVENMIPFERSVFIEQIRSQLQYEKEKARQTQGIR